MTQHCNHTACLGYDNFTALQLLDVDNIKVRNMRHLIEMVESDTDGEFVRFNFEQAVYVLFPLSAHVHSSRDSSGWQRESGEEGSDRVKRSGEGCAFAPLSPTSRILSISPAAHLSRTLFTHISHTHTHTHSLTCYKHTHKYIYVLSLTQPLARLPLTNFRTLAFDKKKAVERSPEILNKHRVAFDRSPELR
jgi:PDZ domain